MARVELQDISKVFPNGIQAVKGLTLDVADGEFVVLVGPSGCGKSTTLRLIAGLDDLSGGTIKIGETIVNNLPAKDRDIAMVFQNYALYPHMKVRQILAFALTLRKTPKVEIERRIRKTAQLLQIEDLLDRRPHQLSGGQRQRVALGRAIVREPDVFLFDEPLSNLDARLRMTTRAELKALHMRINTTTIYVTHDQEEAMTLGNRLAIMNAGEVQQIGTPMEIYQRPINRFVASFVGTPPMNFLQGTILRRGQGTEIGFYEDHLVTAGNQTPLLIPNSWHSVLEERIGTEVMMGIRPQALTLSDSANLDPSLQLEGSSLPVRIKMVEPLGDSIDVYVETTAHRNLVARVPTYRGQSIPQIDDTRLLLVDMEQALFFEGGEFGKLLAIDDRATFP